MCIETGDAVVQYTNQAAKHLHDIPYLLDALNLKGGS
jgi:hypothetical protein